MLRGCQRTSLKMADRLQFLVLMVFNVGHSETQVSVGNLKCQMCCMEMCFMQLRYRVTVTVAVAQFGRRQNEWNKYV